MEDIQSRMRDLGEFIREQRSVARLSLRKLSDMAGISNPYLSQIERMGGTQFDPDVAKVFAPLCERLVPITTSG